MFETNEEKIVGVIEDGLHNKSKDGKWLIESIQSATKTRKIELLDECWEYIKSRNRKTKNNYTEIEKGMLTEFISTQKSKNIYYLYKNGLTGSKGDIESYLPKQYRAKNFNKIIPWIKSSEFIKEISQNNNGVEVISIIEEILGIDTN